MKWIMILTAVFTATTAAGFSAAAAKGAGTERPGPAETVTIVIEAENIRGEKLKRHIEYYLPEEIMPQHILEDMEGFEIKHDAARDQFYLSKEVLFGPYETKRFHVKVKNVWAVPIDIVTGYVRNAAALNDQLKGTDSAPTAEILFRAIKDDADIILGSMETGESAGGYMVTFRGNKKRLRMIEDNLDKLRGLRKSIRKEETKKVRKETVRNIVLMIVAFVVLLTAFFYRTWSLDSTKGNAG